ncbi:hypothetical protein CP97_14818 [Aurantiacibacter atlanticus]|uniref:Uncharacterized protein n=1 Tax=Aurantiacibacter atlanticus TaxID=1648404 RepID=A0A161IGI1_9SPHN|nr:hypothetical protein CP97_14818 [Aurantiacibacter atlanticus]
MEKLLPHRPALLLTAFIVFAAIAVLFAMDRPPMCTCGTIDLWHGKVQSAGNSQHITIGIHPAISPTA